MLPIVQRELRVEARSPKLYRARLRLGVVVIIGAALLLVSSNAGAARRAPGAFFWFLSWLALLFCLLEGVRKTADAISEERREGTLGFLFLTDLRGYDVVLGKFAAGFIRSFNGLLAIVPILAVTLLMGGTTAGEFWRCVLVLVLSLCTSLAVCLAVSATRVDRSATACLVALGIICFLPPAAGIILQALGAVSNVQLFRAASPVFLLEMASEASRLFSASAFWIGALMQVGTILVALGSASFVTPRVWQDKPKRRKKEQKAPEERAVFDKRGWERRRPLLDRNPIFWLAYFPRQHRRFTFVFMGAAILLGIILALVHYDAGGGTEALVIGGLGVFGLGLLLALQLASQASVSIAEARRNGTLELLLSTPLKVRDIIQGQWLALRKTFLPATVVLAAFAVYLWTLGATLFDLNRLFLFSKISVELVLGFFVLGWVGMWSGLVSKTPNGAFFRTIMLGLIVPYLVCTPTILNQLILLAVAMDKVKFQFRRFIAERYLQAPGFILPPPSAQPAAPPVIR